MPSLRPSVIVTGLNGLVGTEFAEKFGSAYELTGVDRQNPSHPTDITNLDEVRLLWQNSSAEFVIHLAAFTDVTAAWQQTGDKTGAAYQVNVTGTENIVRACAETGKHLIHVSTAYVFDGEKPTAYLETDTPHPIEWYGETKYAAEQVVMASLSPWTILRIDQPFRSQPFAKPDAIRKLVGLIQREPAVPLFNNHYFGPTFLGDFSRILDWVLRTKTTGLFHASSGEQWSDFALAEAVNEAFSLGRTLKVGDLHEYLKTSQRPYQKNTALNCQKLFGQLDFKPKTILESLSTIRL